MPNNPKFAADLYFESTPDLFGVELCKFVKAEKAA